MYKLKGMRKKKNGNVNQTSKVKNVTINHHLITSGLVS